jgi:hypothetical protein
VSFFAREVQTLKAQLLGCFRQAVWYTFFVVFDCGERFWRALISCYSPISAMPNHYIQVYDNKDLTDERKNCPFDTDVMCARIYGDPKFVQRRKEILAYVSSVPELNRSSTDTSFMSRMEMMENSAKNTVLLYKYRDKILDPNNAMEFGYLRQ